MDLMSFLSDEEWETVTEPLMEGKANIYPRTAFHRGAGGGNPNKSYLTPGVEDNTAVTWPSSQSSGLVIQRLRVQVSSWAQLFEAWLALTSV